MRNVQSSLTGLGSRSAPHPALKWRATRNRPYGPVLAFLLHLPHGSEVRAVAAGTRIPFCGVRATKVALHASGPTGLGLAIPEKAQRQPRPPRIKPKFLPIKSLEPASTATHY